MAERSFRQTLRRRVAPIAFLAALLLLGMRTCSTEMARVELRFAFGKAAPDVRTFAVDVFRGDEVAPVAYHNADYGAGGAPAVQTWELQLDPGPYMLKIRVTLASGTRQVERRVEASDRAAVTVNLEDELSASP